MGAHIGTLHYVVFSHFVKIAVVQFYHLALRTYDWGAYKLAKSDITFYTYISKFMHRGDPNFRWPGWKLCNCIICSGASTNRRNVVIDGSCRRAFNFELRPKFLIFVRARHIFAEMFTPRTKCLNSTTGGSRTVQLE